MPPDFRFLDMTPQPDVILAVRLDPARQAHGIFSCQMLARLKPGVTPAEARADVERMLPIWLDAWPPFPGTTHEAFENMRITPVVRPLKDDLVGGVASTLWVLMGAIGAVLLVACANIANLMLVRADARRPEFAVRAALGAVPARIARELLVESLVSAQPAACSAWCSHTLDYRFSLPSGRATCRAFRRSPSIRPCSRSPWPFRSRRRSCSARSRHSSTRCTSMRPCDRRRARLEREPRAQHDAQRVGRRAGGARARVGRERGAHDSNVSGAARRRSRFFGPGDHSNGADLDSDRLVPGPEQYTRMEHEILDKIAALPGVASAGFASDVPMEGPGEQRTAGGRRPNAGGGRQPPPRRCKFVSPGYFEAMGTRMIAGRDVTWSDIETGGRVAVISEDFARELATGARGRARQTYSACRVSVRMHGAR